MQSLDGFLGLEARDRGIGSHTPDGAILQRGLELNRRCHEVLVGLGPGQFTQSQLISAALFARLLEFFQGAIKCCAVASRAAAEVLLRAELEACFTLCAVRRDPETLRIWAEQHHFFKRKLVSAIRGGWANWERAQPPGKAQEVCGVLNEYIRSTGLSQLGTLDLAKKADMEQWYQVLYRRLEGPAHSKAIDLERYFRVDADNK
jgi:hypothetical protein